MPRYDASLDAASVRVRSDSRKRVCRWAAQVASQPARSDAKLMTVSSFRSCPFPAQAWRGGNRRSTPLQLDLFARAGEATFRASKRGARRDCFAAVETRRVSGASFATTYRVCFPLKAQFSYRLSRGAKEGEKGAQQLSLADPILSRSCDFLFRWEGRRGFSPITDQERREELWTKLNS